MTTLTIDPRERYELSPYLFMQFMEPLGTTDASVAAAWDHVNERWRPDVIETIARLGPTCIRWGGIYTSFWKWREGVGPRDRRVPAINYLWGGIESNQVGVHEILDLCRQVNAAPLIGVNFSADGRPEYIATPRGENRAGTPEEAADLVSYCNDPEHEERARNGAPAPWGVKLWQIGNETSYPPPGRRFTKEENAREFVRYADAMRRRDPGIKLIGWGDQERPSGEWWAGLLLEEAGDRVDYVAIHMMNQAPRRPDTLLSGYEYRRDRSRAWEELMEIFERVEAKLVEFRDVLAATGHPAKIAITEGHLSLRPHNACPLLAEWLAGLYHAKVMNLYERHGDVVAIATLADFFGNRWTVNAVMVGGPRQRPYLLPVGSVMRLFAANTGTHAVAVSGAGGSLDVTASRKGDRIFLHAVNTDFDRPAPVEIEVAGMRVRGGCAHEIAPGSVSAYVDHERPDTFEPACADLAPGEKVKWSFPAASVSALELHVEPAP